MICEISEHSINRSFCAFVYCLTTVRTEKPSHTNLLCVLFEEAELEALVQLELADVPGLVEVLSGGVQLVEQLGDPWDQALGVGVAHPAAATAAAATAAATIAVGEGLAALDALEQPEGEDNFLATLHCTFVFRFCSYVTLFCVSLCEMRHMFDMTSTDG